MSAEFDDVLTNQPVVIDNVGLLQEGTIRILLVFSQGSGTIKAGFAGQDHPKCFFPSLCVLTVRVDLQH
jgi:centractin